MPVNVIFGVLGVLGGVSVIALLFSLNSVKGITIQSCKGDGSCGCENPRHGKTAERILALLDDNKGVKNEF